MKNISTITSLLLFFAFLTTTHLQARTFTNKAGQSFEGDILKVTPDGSKVTILRAADKKKFEVGVALFTDADQKAIKEWAANNISYSFGIKESHRTLKKSSRKTGHSTIETKQIGYEIEITNRSFKDLKDVKVEYRLYKEGGNFGDGPTGVGQVHGSHKLANISHNGTASFTTKPIDILEEKMDAGWRRVGSDGLKLKMEDDLAGIWIKIYHKGKEVAELQEVDGSLKGMSWGQNNSSSRSRS